MLSSQQAGHTREQVSKAETSCPDTWTVMGGTGVRITHREMGSWMSTYHSYTKHSMKIDVVISSLVDGQPRSKSQRNLLAQRQTTSE